MAAAERVLVVGAGLAGLTASIAMARFGIASQIIEINPSIHALGTAITITGPAVETLGVAGVLGECRRLGHPDCLIGSLYDATGLQINESSPPGARLLRSVGMYRPLLAELLTEQARKLGVDIRYGTTITSLNY